MKIIKLLFISAIFISVKSAAEVKLYEIVIDVKSQFDFNPLTENGNSTGTIYTIKFLLDDERTPDKNLVSQFWDMESNVVSIRSDGASFSITGDERAYEYTHPAECYYNRIGFKFPMDVDVIGELKIIGCNPGIFLDPNNTFSLEEAIQFYETLISINGCTVLGCLYNAETEVNIISINVNPFTGIDNDGDTIPSTIDNCPNVVNPDQLDNDSDNQGNACDTTPNGDDDGDGIDNALDNCLNIENPNQADLDGDSQGDTCDIDIDGDFIRNSIEIASSMDPNDPSDGEQAELSILELLGINKQVPAMGIFGLLTLVISILALGLLRGRNT